MPSIQPWEITFSCLDRRPFAPDEGTRRACIGAVALSFASTEERGVIGGQDRGEIGGSALIGESGLIGGPGLVGFCLRRDRFRLLVHGAQNAVGYRRAGLRRRLTAAVGRPMPDPNVRPIHNRAHLMSILRHYVAPDAAEVFDEPAALASGSCFSDLVGARRVPGMRLATALLLPRLTQRQLYDMLELSVVDPADDDLVRMLGPARVASAASFVVGVDPVLGGTARDVVAARRAAVHLSRAAGIVPAETAWALRITERAVRRLADQPLDGHLDRALRLRLAIQTTVHRDLLRTRAVAG